MTAITSASAETHMQMILSAESDDVARAAAFHELVARPVTADLVSSAVRSLRSHMIPVELPGDPIDTCGTGGSGQKTINTSTLTAFIVAAAGHPVAKHGNRSASGNCGCFDLLEMLGVNIQLTPDQERRLFNKLGIVFLFAPLHHPALKHAGPLRKSYGKKTVFNLFGPLCNPAGVRRQMVGTGNDADAELMAGALQALGSVGSLVVTGQDGLDEVTVTAPTTVRRVLGTRLRSSGATDGQAGTGLGLGMEVFSPACLGLPLSAPSEIEGGSPKTNAIEFLDLLDGNGAPAMRNLVLVNAAHALLLTPLVQNLRDAYALAKETLASGKALALFQSYRDRSHAIS